MILNDINHTYLKLRPNTTIAVSHTDNSLHNVYAQRRSTRVHPERVRNDHSSCSDGPGQEPGRATTPNPCSSTCPRRGPLGRR